jgi:lysophospholipase L1-like esterase/dienelactone hydrolase
MRSLLVLLLFPMTLVAQEQPRVLLLGDSIRIGYAPILIKKLNGIAKVTHIGEENGGDTVNTLKSLERWLAEHKPDLVHINCGLHDLRFNPKTMTYQVSVEQYGKNLESIIERIQKHTPRIIFANTTPILDERHAARKAGFDRKNSDVQKYNDVAMSLMRMKGIPINDLYRIVQHYDPSKLMTKDGTHYTPEGSERLADAAADSIQRQLYAMNPPKLTPPKAGPEAVDAYKKAEAAQDALVPEHFKTIQTPAMTLPKTPEDWAKQRADVKEKVLASLGEMPPRPKTPEVHLVSVEHRPGFRIERIRLGNGLDGQLSAMMLIPDALKERAPTILWLHSSSFDHRQLLVPNTNGGEEPLGLTYIKRGWVVFAPDAAWYGDRAGQGPAGSSENTTNQQGSQLKYHLWFGRTLWGMFVRDDQVALDYLCTRPEVDTKRIGATGISMGSTRSWWLAAVDDRIKAVVGVACLTRYEQLIRHGQLRQHGVYYFVNGLLRHFDVEGVIALIAPRPVLFLTGELDAGSPADGIRIIEEKVRQIYEVVKSPKTFESVRYPDIGHTYTPEMRKRMLAWFDVWLK